MSVFKRKAKPKGGDMTFLEHFSELRNTLVRVVIFFAFAFVGAFLLKSFLYDVAILGPKDPQFITNRLLCDFGQIMNTDKLCINKIQFDVSNLELAGQFRSHLLITFVAALIMTMPFLLFELWMFIKPALKESERQSAGGFLISSNFLFITGVSFGYFIIAPLAINFLYNYTISDQVENFIRLQSYISSVTGVCLASGLIFELPVLVYFLSKISIITPKFLKKYRKHMIVVFFILSAVITPPDVFSQILVALPLLLLYEISIGISKRVYKKKEQKEIENRIG